MIDEKFGSEDFRRIPRAIPGLNSLSQNKISMAFMDFNCCHYENMPMQYIEIFKIVKNENFQ